MRMVLFSAFFTLGVWLLQQQAALPPFSRAGLLIIFPIALIAIKKIWPLSRFTLLVSPLLIAVFACGSGFYYAAWQGEQRLSVSLPYQWQGRDILVVGVVAELPHITERGQRFGFDVEKTLTGQVAVPQHIYLSSYTDAHSEALELHAGERWQFTVRLKQPHGTSNPYGSDFELWALENHYRAIGYVHPKGENIRLDARADGLSYRIESWREAVRDKLNATLGHAPYAGILTALAIGDQNSIPEAQWQIFRRTGVIHLMSISGLHITMLSGIGFALVYWLWRRSTRLTLWLPARKAAVIAACLTALGYSLLAGFGVPAQRTVYMVSAVACALWMNRNFSLAQIMSIALLSVLIADPWAVLAPGFCLSFGAVALILYTTAHRIGRLSGAGEAPSLPSRLRTVLREYAIVQWAMSIGLIPLLLALFGQLSLVSPLANAFAIPLVSLLVVPLTLLGAALPGEIPLWLAHIVTDLTMIPLQALSDLPVWTQHAPPAWSVVVGVLGVLWILAPRGFPARCLGLLLMLPMFLNGPEPPAPGTASVIVFDVGQGLSAAILTRHHALLYDTGPDYSGDADSGKRILIPNLQSLGIRTLDGMMLSHNDTDHTGGTASVLQAMPVSWLSSPHALSFVAPLNTDVRRCHDGTSWNWDGVQFDILNPDPDSQSARVQDNSCVLRIGTGNQHILLTGDIEKRGEQRLLAQHAEQLPANLLVVPHHGSASSSGIDFVAAVLPDYAVFTSGYRNRFGHPRAEILQRYADSGATLLRSDRDGAILIEMNARDIRVESCRKTHRRYWTHQPD